MEGCLESMHQELDVIEQEETKLRGQEVDIKHEVEKYEAVLKENQQKVKHWQKEVRKPSTLGRTFHLMKTKSANYCNSLYNL